MNKLAELLEEARESVKLLANKLHNELEYDYSEEQEQLCRRIDTALAEHKKSEEEAKWVEGVTVSGVSSEEYCMEDTFLQVWPTLNPDNPFSWSVCNRLGEKIGHATTSSKAKAAAIKAARGL